MRTLRWLVTSGSDYQYALHRVPEERNPRIYRCENVEISDIGLCLLKSLNLLLRLREGHRLRVVEYMVLRKKSGLKWDEVTGD